MNKKIFFLIGLFLAISLILIFHLYHRVELYKESFRRTIVNIAEEKLQRAIKIEDLSTNFFNQVTLDQVSIAKTKDFSQGLIFQSEKIIIETHLWNFFLAEKNLFAGDIKVHFYQPQLYLTDKNEKFEWSSFLENAKILGKVKLYFYDGMVYFSIPEPGNKFKPIAVQQLSGNITPQFQLKIKRLNFSFQGRTTFGQGTYFQAKGTVYPYLSKWKLKLALTDFDIREIQHFLNNPKLNIIAGKANLDCQLEGKFLKSESPFSKLDYSGILRLADTKLQINTWPSVINLNAELFFSPNNLTFSFVQLAWKDINFRTPGKIDIKNQTIALKLENGKLWSKNGNLTDVRFHADYRSGEFNLREAAANIGRGNFFLKGRGGKNYLTAEFSAEDIDSEELAKFFPNFKKFFSDITGFSFIIKGDKEKILLVGETVVKETKFGFNSYFSRTGQFSISGKASPQGGVEINGNIKDKIAEIKKGEIFLSPEQKIEFNGQVDWLRRSYYLCFRGENISAQFLPYLSKYYPALTGKTAFFFTSEGSFQSPSIKGELSIANLFGQKDRQVFFNFSYQDKILMIKDFSLFPETVKGNLAIKFLGAFPELKLSGDLSLSQKDTPLISGLFQGKINTSPVSEQWEGELQTNNLKILQKSWGELRVKVFYQDNNLDFSLIRLGNIFSGEVNVYFAQEEGAASPSLTGQGNYALPIKSLLAEGKGELAGIWSLSGTVAEPYFEGSLKITEGYWRKIKFSALGKFQAKKELIDIYYYPLFFQGPDWSVQTEGNFSLQDLKNFIYTGKVEKGKISWRGEEWNKIKADFSGRGKSLEFEYLNIRAPEKEWWLNAGSKIEFEPNKIYFNLSSEIRNINIFGFDFFGGVDEAGFWDYSGDNHFGQVTFTCRDLWVNQHDFEKTKVKVELRPDQLKFLPLSKETYQWSGMINWSLPGIINFSDVTLSQNKNVLLRIRGLLGKDLPQEAVIEGNDIPNTILLELMNSKTPSAGETNFYILAKGAFDNPYIYGNLNMTDGEIADLPYNLFSVNFDYFRSVLSFHNLEMFQKGKYFLSGRGNIPFGSKKEPFSLYFVLKDSSLNTLTYFSKDIKKAQGLAKGWINISGDKEEPLIDGYLAIEDGKIQAADIFKKVTDLNLELLIKKNRLSINAAAAKIGRGQLALSGEVSFKNLLPKEYNLHLYTPEREIPITLNYLTIPQSALLKKITKLSVPSSGDCKIDLTLNGSGENPRIKGNIEFINTHFTFPPTYIKETEKGLIDNFLKQVYWDLSLKTGRNVWYENEFVSLLIQGDLKIEGKRSFLVNAHFESEKGDLNYLGNNFEIKRVVFDVLDSVPYLSGSAETQIVVSAPQDPSIQIQDTITMEIERSRLGEKPPRFSSKNYPTLSQEKLLAAITGFEGEVTSAADKELILRREIVKLLDSSLATPIVKNILRRTGLVDIIRVSRAPGQVEETKGATGAAQSTLSEILKGTKYTVGKYLFSRWLLEYSLSMESLQNRLDLRHETELTYRLKSNIYLHGIYEIPSKTIPGREYNRAIFLEHQSRFGRE